MGCILVEGLAVTEPVLINQTEYIKTVGNVSNLNNVYLGFYEGLQYSVLGPAHIPDELDFQATSYGSHTECRIVTTQCGAQSTYGGRNDTYTSSNFACNNTMADLNMTGNFYYLGQPSESYEDEGYNNTGGIENVNTLSQNAFGFGFQYFNDSAKQEQVTQVDDYGLGAALYTPITNITNQFYWALVFKLDILLDVLGNANQTSNPWARLNLVASVQGGAEGIMSCETSISEIVRLAHASSTTSFPCLCLHIHTLLLPLQSTLTSPSLRSDL